jgi:hypothetical protein
MLIDLDDKPDRIQYGFLLGNELLHKYRHWGYQGDEGSARWELTVPKWDKDTNGEWLADSINTVLHMYLDPSYFTNDGPTKPLPTYGEARPVAIHTWCEGEWMHKAYIPLEVPTLLPYMDVISVTVTIASTEVQLAGGGIRKLYAYRGSTTTPVSLSVGGRYYSAGYGELRVYECIAAVGDQYLLLLLEDDELPTKLVGQPMGAVAYHDD